MSRMSSYRTIPHRYSSKRLPDKERRNYSQRAEQPRWEKNTCDFLTLRSIAFRWEFEHEANERRREIEREKTISSNFLMIEWKINWVSSAFRGEWKRKEERQKQLLTLRFILILMKILLFALFAENWMSFEDFLQHCTAKHRSYRSNHRQGGAMHWMLDGDCGFAEDGKIFAQSFLAICRKLQFNKHFFSSFPLPHSRRQSKDRFTTTILITSMTCTPMSMAATEVEWTLATSVMAEAAAAAVEADASEATEVCVLDIILI